MTLPLNIDVQQILLHLLNFVVLFTALYVLLYSPVKKFMDARVDHYKKMDEEASAKIKEAEATKKEYEEKLASSEEEIAKEKAAAFHDMEARSKKRMSEVEAEAAEILKEAHNDAQAIRKKILKETRAEASDIVASAAEKLVADATTSEAFDQFLNSAKRGEENE